MVKKLFSFLTLFASFSTLICCALPALFVTLGLGATLVSVLSAFPQLIWLSEHKGVVFGVAGILLVLSGLLQRTAAPCPTDPALSAACSTVRGPSKKILLLSVVAFCVGGFFAFVAPLLASG